LERINNAEVAAQSEAAYYPIFLERLKKPTQIIAPFFGLISETE
jgi:hypothetical protein